MRTRPDTVRHSTDRSSLPTGHQSFLPPAEPCLLRLTALGVPNSERSRQESAAWVALSCRRHYAAASVGFGCMLAKPSRHEEYTGAQPSSRLARAFEAACDFVAKWTSPGPMA